MVFTDDDGRFPSVCNTRGLTNSFDFLSISHSDVAGIGDNDTLTQEIGISWSMLTKTNISKMDRGVATFYSALDELSMVRPYILYRMFSPILFNLVSKLFRIT